MTEVLVESQFISVGCNRYSGALRLARNGLCAFGAYHNIALCYPMNLRDYGIRKIIHGGHKANINCVDFLYIDNKYGDDPLDNPNGILSGSNDGYLSFWDLNCKCPASLYVDLIRDFKAHEASITAITSLPYKLSNISNSSTIFATSAVDNLVKIWRINSFAEPIECIQMINLGRHYALALSMTYISSIDSFLLAIGGTDHLIHIYLGKISGNFELAFILKGHENWIRGLSFATFLKENTDSKETGSFLVDIYLASGSQDKYVRLWLFSVKNHSADNKSEEYFSSSFTRSSTSQKKKLTYHFCPYPSTTQCVLESSFESLLVGHDDWIYSVQWCPSLSKDTFLNDVKTLISASSDGMMMLWAYDPFDQLWKNKTSMGDLNDTFGYYGVSINTQCNAVVAHSHSGSLHYWTFHEDKVWKPMPSVTGHFGPVECLSFCPDGPFFASVSVDQTTRIFAPHRHSTSTHRNDRDRCTWHEIARPQIHGYDLQTISFIPRKMNDSLRFASAGDEKVIRVFEATKQFIRGGGLISQKSNEWINQLISLCHVDKADVPALGLTNKAIESPKETLNPSEIDGSSHSKHSILPTENFLSRHSLWPEVEKLYGHSYEIYTLTANHSGSLVAASCKSTIPDYAGIRLWKTNDWRNLQEPLNVHSLTVTKIVFSYNDEYILSVSRDRSWALFQLDQNSRIYKLLQHQMNAHSRIIWCAAWTLDDRYFLTGSRDKKIKIWSHDSNSKIREVGSFEFSDSVTSIATIPLFNQTITKADHYFAVGLETGALLIVQFSSISNELAIIHRFHKSNIHSATVKDIRIIKSDVDSKQSTYSMVTCSDDHSIRLLSITFINSDK